MLRINLGNPVTGPNLFGRERVIARIWERLEAGAHLQLMAPRRVGKTSIMRELERAPRDGWTAVYLDLESDDAPGDAIAQMLASVATHPETRTWFEEAVRHMPFRDTIQDVLGRVTSASAGVLKVELQQAIGRDWRVDAEKLAARLAALPRGHRLLIILDELPILVNRIFHSPSGAGEAKLFLETLRHLRQRPDLAQRVQFLIGGSVGLHTILHRHKASATANDLEAIPLAPWPRPTAAAFLEEVGVGESFPLPDVICDGLLDRLGEDLVPFHVQLFFSALRDAADGDPAGIDARMLDPAFRRIVADPRLNHYAERLSEQLSPEDLSVARRLLVALCATGSGFAPRTLFKKVGIDAQQAGLVARLLEDEGYLVLDENTGKLRFRSEVLRSYWKRRQAAFDGEYR